MNGWRAKKIKAEFQETLGAEAYGYPKSKPDLRGSKRAMFLAETIAPRATNGYTSSPLKGRLDRSRAQQQVRRGSPGWMSFASREKRQLIVDPLNWTWGFDVIFDFRFSLENVQFFSRHEQNERNQFSLE
jgi:hypothetical protein